MSGQVIASPGEDILYLPFNPCSIIEPISSMGTFPGSHERLDFFEEEDGKTVELDISLLHRLLLSFFIISYSYPAFCSASCLPWLFGLSMGSREKLLCHLSSQRG